MKKMNKKGFTLMEVLIVVAIIAVLVAIAIPVMNNRLENAREAVDAANLRTAYAEIMTAALLNTNEYPDGIEVVQKQTKAGWGTTFDFPDNLTFAGVNEGAPGASGKWTLNWDGSEGVVATYSTE